MNRREFIKTAALSGIGLSLPFSFDALFTAGESAAGSELVVAHGASPSKITRAAIDAMGGMRKFISRGDIVVVKPNIGWDRTVEQAANTNPEVVATVIQMCFEAGAKKVKAFDRPVNDPRRCYVQSGILDAVKSLGAEMDYMDARDPLTLLIPEEVRERRLHVMRGVRRCLSGQCLARQEGRVEEHRVLHLHEL